MYNSLLSRREFIRRVLLLSLLATPIGAWVVREWRKAHQPKQDFTHLAFPLIRRVFPNLIASELVSIQPMTSPTAMIFYMDFKYRPRRRTFAQLWNQRVA